jgi:hypothetical protein
VSQRYDHWKKQQGCEDILACMDRHLLAAVQRYAHCFRSMQTYERREDFKYEFVMRLRTDHAVYARLPELPTFVSPGIVKIWRDQFAFSHRSDASAVLVSPSFSYSVCHNRTQWERICAPQTVPSNWNCSMGVPCESMLSIRLYSDVTVQVHPMRAYLAVKPEAPYDFCLKRAWIENSS